MKKVSLIFTLILVALFGCSFSADTKSTDNADKVLKQEIDLIWVEYSSANQGNKNRRKVEIEKCTQDVIDFYKRDAFYSEKLGDFASCDFVLNDYTDPKCPSSRLVIKKCDAESKCKYEFSELDLGTCE